VRWWVIPNYSWAKGQSGTVPQHHVFICPYFFAFLLGETSCRVWGFAVRFENCLLELQSVDANRQAIKENENKKPLTFSDPLGFPGKQHQREKASPHRTTHHGEQFCWIPHKWTTRMFAYGMPKKSCANCTGAFFNYQCCSIEPQIRSDSYTLATINTNQSTTVSQSHCWYVKKEQERRY